MDYDDTDPTAELDALAPRFEALGLDDIAARLRALAGSDEGQWRFPRVPAHLSAEDVLTIEGAAAVLGLRSPSMVMTMAELGTLEAFSRDEEVLLSRSSVEAYLGSPKAGLQRQVQDELFSLLGDLGDFGNRSG